MPLFKVLVSYFHELLADFLIPNWGSRPKASLFMSLQNPTIIRKNVYQYNLYKTKKKEETFLCSTLQCSRAFFFEAWAYSILLAMSLVARWFPSYPPAWEGFVLRSKWCSVTTSSVGWLIVLYSSMIKYQPTVNNKQNKNKFLCCRKTKKIAYESKGKVTTPFIVHIKFIIWRIKGHCIENIFFCKFCFFYFDIFLHFVFAIALCYAITKQNDF